MVSFRSVNRNHFRRLAGIRIKDAETLLRNGRYEGCYYLCGYVIECGLKACIAKLTRRHDFPDKTLLQDAYTHDLSKLVKAAKLEAMIDAELDRNREFRLNRYVVKNGGTKAAMRSRAGRRPRVYSMPLRTERMECSDG